MNTNSIKGYEYLFQGFSLIFEKQIRLYIIIPVLINILFFISLFSIGIHYFHELTQWLNHLLPKWLHWLQWFLWIIFTVLILTIYAYTFTVLTNLISTPFNAFLSEKVEYFLTGHTLESATLVTALKTIPRAINRQIQLIIYYLLRAAILLLLSFIPVVHIFATIAWFLFTAWMLTIQYIDYPMDNHHISFKNLRQTIGQKQLLSFSFGISTLLFLYIPIINFFVMPAAVAGATAMWVKEYKDQN